MNSTCRSRHAASLWRGGSMLGVAINKSRLQNSYANWWEDGPVPSEHAEAAIIRQCNNLGIDTAGAILYVSRVNRLGEERYSRPCPNCQELILEAGIRRVVFTVGDGRMETYP